MNRFVFYITKLSLLLILTGTSGVAKAQDGHAFIDINNINARINAAGDLFWDLEYIDSYYQVPKGGSLGTILLGNLWVAAGDESGDLSTAAYITRDHGGDFSQGPMMDAASYSVTLVSIWNRVWKIHRSTIDSFRQGLFTNIPPIIQEWPANGDISLGQAPTLAPFEDVDNNGRYEPSQGDYPRIRGDQAIFFIYNDDRSPNRESGGKQLGIEVHAMAYAFDCVHDPALWNTVFFHYDIYNRSEQDHHNMMLGLYLDFDIGDFSDDYIGCDTNYNSFYAYNADNNDGDAFYGYGANPPAQGAVFLNKKMSNFMVYSNGADSSGVCIRLDYQHYYNLMNSRWIDGSPLTYGGPGFGGTRVTKYAFSGNPAASSGWTEGLAANPPGDKKGVGSAYVGTLLRGQKTSLDIAYVTGRKLTGNSNNLTSVTDMRQKIAVVKSYFDNNNTPCGTFSTGLEELSDIGLSVYPNPANEYLYINSKLPSLQATYTILNALGTEIASGMIYNGENTLSIANYTSGVYILQVRIKDEIQYHKFIKE